MDELSDLHSMLSAYAVLVLTTKGVLRELHCPFESCV